MGSGWYQREAKSLPSHVGLQEHAPGSQSSVQSYTSPPQLSMQMAPRVLDGGTAYHLPSLAQITAASLWSSDPLQLGMVPWPLAQFV